MEATSAGFWLEEYNCFGMSVGSRFPVQIWWTQVGVKLFISLQVKLEPFLVKP